MSEKINPLVVDLSHWITSDDYPAVKKDGIYGVIFKATEGQGFTDDKYVQQQKAAKAAGLRWGAYHFADGSNTDGQVRNFMTFACPDPDEMFVLDWEDNPTGNGKMSKSQAKDWITQVETQLKRPGECVIYGGNTLKELVGDDPFFGSRRLWLCHYASTPVLPEAWKTYWLWQFTDGNYGPEPHSIDGIGHCDINSYQGTPEQLIAEWASGSAKPEPAPPAALFTTTGRCSWFGGPDDEGVSPSEGLAFHYEITPENWHLFLALVPAGTTGLARRLNSTAVNYLACRWNYDVTSKKMLADANNVALVTATKTGRSAKAWPADWGPHEEQTGRAADLSPCLMDALGIATDDEVTVVYPYED